MARRNHTCWRCKRTVNWRHKRGGQQCELNINLNKLGDEGYVGIPKNTLNAVRENGIHFIEEISKYSYKQGKQKAETTVFVKSDVAHLCNNFKGKCLRFLLKAYATKPGFKAHYTNVLKGSHNESLIICLEEFLYSKEVHVDKHVLLDMLPTIIEDCNRLEEALKKAIPVSVEVASSLPFPSSTSTKRLSHYDNVDADVIKKMRNNMRNLIERIEIDARR